MLRLKVWATTTQQIPTMVKEQDVSIFRQVDKVTGKFRKVMKVKTAIKRGKISLSKTVSKIQHGIFERPFEWVCVDERAKSK